MMTDLNLETQEASPDDAYMDGLIVVPDSVFDDVKYIRAQVERIEPVIDALVTAIPELLPQIIPIVEGIKTSPVLKMLGVRLDG